MDSQTHSEIIEAEVKISQREDDSFSACNGMVTGNNLTIK